MRYQATVVAVLSILHFTTALSVPPVNSSEPTQHEPTQHSHGSQDTHHHSGPVLASLNETAVELQHGPQRPSYLTHDFQITVPRPLVDEHAHEWEMEVAKAEEGDVRKWMMGVHVVMMTLGYFAALPIALALRAVKHEAHHAVHAGFLIFSILGWFAGIAYRAGTPDLYEGSVHATQGDVLLILSIALAALDYFDLLRRAYNYLSTRDGPRSLSGLRQAIFPLQDTTDKYEVIRLSEEVHPRRRRSSDQTATDEPTEITFMSPRASDHHHRPSRLSIVTTSSPASEHTLYGSHHDLHGEMLQGGALSKHVEDWEESGSVPRWADGVEVKKSWRQRFEDAAVTTGIVARRLMVFGAYVVTITGLVTYIGFCRGNYLNTCLAHIIKGSIFFLYGVLTFSRYAGAFADCGWAWNKPPVEYTGPSAELVECFVVFTYGITNTWMERMGAAPGSAYTIKQIQHISIAVMYWFAGLTGIILESKTIRGMIGGRHAGDEGSSSHSTSFNPLTAIVIGVTGIAMAAHHQDYAFQVSIHSLWGVLLAGGSVFRCITYFSLWIHPGVASESPSRPPTELLTAFGYTAGGIVFMLSDEEVAFTAMRAGYDDMMAFLNLTIALTSFVFCWVLVVLACKAWATRH